jgi:hypothetical protein
MHENLELGLMQLIRSEPELQKRLVEMEEQVAAGRATAFNAVRTLLSFFASKIRTSPQ